MTDKNHYKPSQDLMSGAIKLVGYGFGVIPLDPIGVKEDGKAGIGHNQYSSVITTVGTVTKRWGGKTKFNIGIVTGAKDEKGIMVLDLDIGKKGGANGLKIFKKWLEEEGQEMPDTVITNTPSGGMHLYFKWDSRLRNGSVKDCGMDFKTGTDNTYGGHVVAPPSAHPDGTPYTWLNSPDNTAVGEIPNWLVARLIRVGQGVVPNNVSGIRMADGRSRGTGRGNDNVTDADLEEIVPLEQVNRMVSGINPDNLEYDEWLRIGLAIHSQYPDDDGLEVWDEWSSSGTRYKEGECHKRWNAFDPNGGTRMATLFWYAEQGGYTPKKNDVKANQYRKLMEEYNRNHAMILEGGKNKYLIKHVLTDDERKDNITKPYSLIKSKSEFCDFMAHDTYPVVEKNKTVEKPFAPAWLRSKECRKYPKGIELRPSRWGEPRQESPDKFNVWCQWARIPRMDLPYEELESQCAPLINHVREVLCGGNDEDTEYALDWMAWGVQNPNEKPGTAWVTRGDEGVGKGIIGHNFLGAIYAKHYVHTVHERHVTGNFNAHQADALYMFADELKLDKNTIGAIQALVTEGEGVNEKKGVDAETGRSLIRLFTATNSEFAIPAGKGSRRWFVTDVSSIHKGNKKYFKRLVNWLDNGGVELMFGYLLNRKITHNIREAPITNALSVQRAKTDGGHYNDFIIYLLEQGECILNPDGKPCWPNWFIEGEYDVWMEAKDRLLGGWDKPVKKQTLGRKLRQQINIAMDGFMPGNAGDQVWMWNPKIGKKSNTKVHNLTDTPIGMGMVVAILADVSLEEVEVPEEWKPKNEEY